MQRATWNIVIAGTILFRMSGDIGASEGDELRERAQDMRQRASVIVESAKSEAARLLESAERLERKGHESETLTERTGTDKRVGTERELHELKRRAEQLRQKERQMREANAPERHLDEIHEQRVSIERELAKIAEVRRDRHDDRPEFRAQIERLETEMRRIRHIRIAAEHLEQADAYDFARPLTEKAALMEREVHEARQRLSAEIRQSALIIGERGQVGLGQAAVRELKEEIESLRREIKELNQKIEQR